jgi:hypothetical protein
MHLGLQLGARAVKLLLDARIDPVDLDDAVQHAQLHWPRSRIQAGEQLKREGDAVLGAALTRAGRTLPSA